MWILGALITITIIASIYREQSGLKLPSYMNCKESIFQQMLSNECTLRKGFKNSNSFEKNK